MHTFNGFSWAGTRTDKFEETKEFFTTFFGVQPTYEEEGFVKYDLANGQTFEIFSVEYKGHHHFTTGPVLGFDVEDIDAARNEMEAAGVEFIGSTDGDVTQSRWAHFRGPDGNVYELKWRPKQES